MIPRVYAFNRGKLFRHQRSLIVTCRTPDSPLFLNTASMGALSDRTSATSPRTPAARAIAARCVIRAVPIPRPWKSSMTLNSACPDCPTGAAHDRVSSVFRPRRYERNAIDEVDIREESDLLFGKSVLAPRKRRYRDGAATRPTAASRQVEPRGSPCGVPCAGS
jgi:hypothetical protein